MLQSKESPVNSEQFCTDFTLDVAWKQILGFDLAEDEILAFQEAVNTLVGGFADLRVVFNVFAESTPAFKARDCLINKIEDRIDFLRLNGLDSSTLSGMVFATDEEDSSLKLTQEEIVENSMLLILAWTETSATTLTNAMLCLGLNQDVWMKLVEEQQKMRAKHGEELTRGALDKECPYLDAVVRETMIIKPISSGAPRFLMGLQL
uniref:Cytochrome P450 n=1 Tax=Odontella aurita TaxID=265563 RepID=A0A7S4HR57_9STRA|mmetsp:Transcript_13936/g.40772  ORF Transcript_13936/g.40772 Transcript_13936/m.40772 type:complete len:206 (+) Transcript_13936:690-1307(+)